MLLVKIVYLKARVLNMIKMIGPEVKGSIALLKLELSNRISSQKRMTKMERMVMVIFYIANPAVDKILRKS